jgi:ribokinase
MITVFGSINLDQVYQMPRLPQPGETLLGDGYMQVPGGKGANQALAAKRSGAKVSMLGCVGHDVNAELALSLLREEDVDLSHLQYSDNPTGCASIWVTQEGENSIVVYSGANGDLKAENSSKRVLGESDYVLFQMEVPSAENQKMLQMAKEAGAYTVLNLAPAMSLPDTALSFVDFLIVNEVEVAFLATEMGIESNDIDQLIHHFSTLYDLCCVVTLGGEGVKAGFKGEQYSVPAQQVEVVDTTAAGDSFIGGLCASLDRGDSLQDALIFATRVAGLTCTKMGAQTSLPYLRESL